MTTLSFANPLAHTLDRMGTLARALDQVLPDEARGAAPVWVPPLEVAERGDGYLIAAELPGVREDQVEVDFENNVLTIRGSKAPAFGASQEGALRVHVFERQVGAFERAVRLPEYVEGDRIEAQFVDGVLQVKVPKAPAAQPRKIQITGGTSAPGGSALPSSGNSADDRRGTA